MNIFSSLVYNENKNYNNKEIIMKGDILMAIPMLTSVNTSVKRETATQEKKNPNSHVNENTSSYLLDDIHTTKRDIETLLLHLDYQTDPDLIDSYSYQLKGAYMRYKFLLRQIQQDTN